MITFSTAINNALADPSAEAVWLVKISDTNNTTRLTSWAADVTIGSETWQSTPELISINPPSGCVINRGADLQAEISFHDPEFRYFSTYQSYSTVPVDCEVKLSFIHNSSFTSAISLIAGAVKRVASRNGVTRIGVGSKLDLNDRNPVLMTDQAQRKISDNDTTFFYLDKDVYVDWRDANE